MNRNQRILVALARTEQDRPLLRYARQLAVLGIGRQFQFVHVRAPAVRPPDPLSDAEVERGLASMVAEEFGPPGSEVAASCHVVHGVRVDCLIEFAIHSRSDVLLLGHRRARSGQRSLARRLAMIAPCSVWLLPEGAPGTIRRVIAAVDFSDNSADSLAVAAAIARAAGSDSCLAAHVYFDPEAIYYDDQWDEANADAESTFTRFVADLNCPGVRVDPIFAEGPNVAGALLDMVEEHGADLLVMSTRGRSRAASILLGSVTSQVLVESRRSVLAVKHFGAMMGLFQALRAGHFWDRPNFKTN